ncbi:protelomerase family protein [Nocardia brasiliensis]|uniref:protelomerase family protein n=1 Tax=Nocardia brasiliensis TaxID=37326 RepID=UPI0024584194|nr:protelomerase family protein [Nocardia brasiliensis]
MVNTSISQAEAQRIDEFLTKSVGLTKDQLRMRALSELSWIHNRRKKGDEEKGDKYSPLTNRKLIIAYRNAIVDKFGDKSELLNYLRYSEARTEEYVEHQAVQRDAKHRDMRSLDAEEFVDAALILLGHCMKIRWSTPAAIAALCALTGRRSAEIGLTAQFAPVLGNRHEAIFTGQLKTRDDARAMESYVIPLLGDRDLILEAMEMMRTKIGSDIDAKKFNSRYGKEIGIQSKRAFKDTEGIPLIPSDLREAYAAIAFYQFAPKRTSEVRYKCDVLGHKFMDTTVDYLGFTIE